MSKFTFRTKALEPTRPLQIYREADRPDVVAETAHHSRSAPALPTGMEKEEEEEVHVQNIINAQSQRGNLAGHGLVIPTPKVEQSTSNYEALYPADYEPPKHYIRAQLFVFAEESPPDYDLDTEDEEWLDTYNKSTSAPLTPLELETMMYEVEQNWPISFHRLSELSEAKDKETLKIVYNYYGDRVKTLKRDRITPRLKPELGDGASVHDPFVAFRRRVEKMQTRKNRHNQETQYASLVKLQKDLLRAKELFSLVKDRESCKIEVLRSHQALFHARLEAEDWDGSKTQAHMPWLTAMAAQHDPIADHLEEDEDDEEFEASTNATSGAKAAHRGIKFKQDTRKAIVNERLLASRLSSSAAKARALAQKNKPQKKTEVEEEDNGETSAVTEDELIASNPFRFRRRSKVLYHEPLSQPATQLRHTGRYRYFPAPSRNVRRGQDTGRMPLRGFCRRRFGRGGRVIVDRLHPMYDICGDLDEFTPEQLEDAEDGDVASQLLEWRQPAHARPRTLGVNLPTASMQPLLAHDEYSIFNAPAGTAPSLSFPSAGNDFGSGGEDVGSGPLIRSPKVDNAWIASSRSGDSGDPSDMLRRTLKLSDSTPSTPSSLSTSQRILDHNGQSENHQRTDPR